MSPETHNPGTQAPSFGGTFAATPQAFTRTSAYIDQRENFGSISTRPYVRSRQADYGHVLIPPLQADEPRNVGSRHTPASIG